jgi:hypothetical protein
MAVGEVKTIARKLRVKKKGKAFKQSINKTSKYYEKPYRGQGR